MSDDRIEQAARVIGKHMSLWDMQGRPDVDGGIDMALARELHDAGLLAPASLLDVQDRAWTEGWAACDEWRTMAPASQPEPASPYSQDRTEGDWSTDQ
ncbi:hypothetical protein [Dietzia sp. ANT_WB102]|uniref:hypothetical protein n=1 Tax=Dietzia sp. ANT_WB102 TaxID=2597345 RepID=UPI0011F0063B|nr:hypothetical protein [Dietzia sp. ANT_WB102]KAA0916446.1 hypothetical protein FQ137_14575 [Dietzia sp. ANT_WB102]